MKNTDKMKLIKNAFLNNIGIVIKRYRNKNNLSQKELGEKIDVKHSSIARYEAGKSDISAAKMAYLSVILDFPLKEYIEYQMPDSNSENNSITLDKKFRELIHISEQSKESNENKNIIVSNRPPKPNVVYDQTSNEWKMVPPTSEEKKNIDRLNASKKYLEQYNKLDIDNEIRFFVEYCNNTDNCKSELLLLVYNLVTCMDYEIDDVRPLINATINFITNDRNHSIEQRLKAYKKYLKCRETLHYK